MNPTTGTTSAQFRGQRVSTKQHFPSGTRLQRARIHVRSTTRRRNALLHGSTNDTVGLAPHTPDSEPHTQDSKPRILNPTHSLNLGPYISNSNFETANPKPQTSNQGRLRRRFGQRTVSFSSRRRLGIGGPKLGASTSGSLPGQSQK